MSKKAWQSCILAAAAPAVTLLFWSWPPVVIALLAVLAVMGFFWLRPR